MTKPAPAPTAPAAQTVDGTERRDGDRAQLTLKARYRREVGEERACVVEDISPSGALLQDDAGVGVGETLILYIDQVGRFEAEVVRCEGATFAVKFRIRDPKRARTKAAIESLVAQGPRGAERREHPRIGVDDDGAGGPGAAVILPDGAEAPCSIRDISLTGASIDIADRPPIGAEVVLGKMAGVVVRHHDAGVVIAFTGSASKMDAVIKGSAPHRTLDQDF
ncbi:MAG: PilZ domain-containing protein [Pseudomonadota bacterium]